MFTQSVWGGLMNPYFAAWVSLMPLKIKSSRLTNGIFTCKASHNTGLGCKTRLEAPGTARKFWKKTMQVRTTRHRAKTIPLGLDLKLEKKINIIAYYTKIFVLPMDKQKNKMLRL